MTARPKLGNMEESTIFKYEDPMLIFKRERIVSRRSSPPFFGKKIGAFGKKSGKVAAVQIDLLLDLHIRIIVLYIWYVLTTTFPGGPNFNI
jgi:hypothetical protein